MPAGRGKSFKSGNSMAVRVPKEFAFEDGAELVVIRSGDVMTIYPEKKKTIAEMIDALRKLPKPGYIEERDTEEIPEPKGL